MTTPNFLPHTRAVCLSLDWNVYTIGVNVLRKKCLMKLKKRDHVRHNLLPVRTQTANNYNLRNTYEFQIPIAKKTRR
jgi:hypothetical protein